MLKKIQILDVGITNETTDKISEYIFDVAKKGKEKCFIVTPNPEMLVYASKHSSFKETLNKANIALPDGVGVFIAAGLLGHKLQERVPGVDFMEELCRKASKRPVSIGFLGGRRGVARRTADCLAKRYPGLKVRWVGEEWDNTRHDKKVMQSDVEKGDIKPYISSHDPIDILFVAYGFPKQENWIAEHLDKLPVKVAMGVGGAFDYVSGDVVRAPFMIRAVGFEWLFRLIRQPWRFKRQLALLEFVYLLLRASSRSTK
jgi:N-acetylglucosaminyldiphosphoundecaprenol N-acetyl-beta-D-mannosaminyltransferase